MADRVRRCRRLRGMAHWLGARAAHAPSKREALLGAFTYAFGTNSLSETGIRWGQTLNRDAGGTRRRRNRDLSDSRRYFVAHAARFSRPKRACIGVRP